MRDFSYLIACSMNTGAKIYALFIASLSYLLITCFQTSRKKNRSELLTDVDVWFEGTVKI